MKKDTENELRVIIFFSIIIGFILAFSFLLDWVVDAEQREYYCDEKYGVEFTQKYDGSAGYYFCANMMENGTLTKHYFTEQYKDYCKNYFWKWSDCREEEVVNEKIICRNLPDFFEKGIYRVFVFSNGTCRFEEKGKRRLEDNWATWEDESDKPLIDYYEEEECKEVPCDCHKWGCALMCYYCEEDLNDTR